MPVWADLSAVYMKNGIHVAFYVLLLPLCARLLSMNVSFFLYRRTVGNLGQALMTEPDNVKALYRRAVVYRLRDQFK